MPLAVARREVPLSISWKERGVGTTVDRVAAVVAATAKVMATVSKFVAATFKLVAATACSGCGVKGRDRRRGGRSG